MSQVLTSKTRQWDMVEASSLFVSVGSAIVALALQQRDIHQYKSTIAQLEWHQPEKFSIAGLTDEFRRYMA